jgi:hypothetical protein
MEGFVFQHQRVFLYRTMLFSASPLLQEIYADSHRFEPWSVRGDPRRVGRIAQQRTLYVNEQEREELLAEIPHRLARDARFVDEVAARLRSDARQLSAARRSLRATLEHEAVQGDGGAGMALRLCDATARVLAPGIFKEALTTPQVEALLDGFVPRRAWATRLLSLYQPLCLPHFVLFEERLLAGAAAYGSVADEAARAQVVARTIERAAHFMRFQLERGALHEPAAMAGRLQSLLDEHGGAAGVTTARERVLQRHHRAVLDAHAAADGLLRAARRLGPATLRSRQLLRGIVRMVQWMATTEELKHVLALQAASTLQRWMERRGRRVEDTDRAALQRAVDAAVAVERSL